MQLETLSGVEMINQEDLNIIQGGFAAASTVESTSGDSDTVSEKKDGNTLQ
ncbi:hypothetical protein [Tenacibaculum ascidiaceicola]|uniref:hypothetical protein n=1 Tax=Tenacibaculum ascidiaceicola TaxID=1699411 RepID=UPI003894738B